jgi:hypothetical protein
MRLAVVLALAAGAFIFAPRPASALPLALGDHAAMSQTLAGGEVEQVRRRSTYGGRYTKPRRRYDWTYYPYWRPYQYRYWQFYYPYGGPLF